MESAYLLEAKEGNIKSPRGFSFLPHSSLGALRCEERRIRQKNQESMKTVCVIRRWHEKDNCFSFCRPFSEFFSFFAFSATRRRRHRQGLVDGDVKISTSFIILSLACCRSSSMGVKFYFALLGYFYGDFFFVPNLFLFLKNRSAYHNIMIVNFTPLRGRLLI